MTRHLRLLGLVSIAMLALFVAPTVVTAQTPTQDQYAPAPDSDTDPADDSGAGTNPADDSGAGTSPATDAGNQAPVDVQEANGNGTLPFTGGNVPLIALIGLALLTAGLVGTAATRKRRMSGAL